MDIIVGINLVAIFVSYPLAQYQVRLQDTKLPSLY